MAGNLNKNDGSIADINVTPLVDVMLVLLVIFMITAPLMLNGIRLDLPKTKEVNPINLTTSQVILSLTVSGELYLGEDKFLKEEIIQEINELFKQNQTDTVFLRADFSLKYGAGRFAYVFFEKKRNFQSGFSHRIRKMKLLSSKENLVCYMKHSFVLHCAFFLICFLASRIIFYMFDGERSFNLKLVEGSVRVDVVDMPKITLQELKRLPPIVQDAKDTLPAKGIGAEGIEFQKPTEGGSLATYLKSLSQGRVEKSTKPKKKAKARIKNQKELKRLILAGNKMSSGRALTGKAGGQSSNFEIYLESIPDRVRLHWSLPSYLGNSELKCRIRIYLNKDGKLLRAVIHESSGNEEYDAMALNAVKKASFLAPDESFRREVLDGNILLGFPL